MRTGQEFLEASWLATGSGGAAPIDVSGSAYQGLTTTLEHSTATGRPVVALSPLVSGDDEAVVPGVHEIEPYRGDTDRAIVDLRAHVASGGAAVLVLAGHGTAQRSLEQLREAEVPATLVEELVDEPDKGMVTVTCGRLLSGFTATEISLVLLSESDLTGSRAGLDAAGRAGRRPVVATRWTWRCCSPATTSCTTSTASASSSRCASAPCRARRASTWCWSTRAPSAASPPTACSCPPTRSTRSAATSAASSRP